MIQRPYDSLFFGVLPIVGLDRKINSPGEDLSFLSYAPPSLFLFCLERNSLLLYISGGNKDWFSSHNGSAVVFSVLLPVELKRSHFLVILPLESWFSSWNYYYITNYHWNLLCFLSQISAARQHNFIEEPRIHSSRGGRYLLGLCLRNPPSVSVLLREYVQGSNLWIIDYQ